LLNVSLVHSDIISKVSCHHNFVVFERGNAALDTELNVRAMLDADSRVFEY
jgi:hypothetical protein